jgi:hypothetical protein
VQQIIQFLTDHLPIITGDDSLPAMLAQALAQAGIT